MGYDVGASGMFGILLSEYAEQLGPIYTDLVAAVEQLSAADRSLDRDEVIAGLGEEWHQKLVARFAEIGIVVPVGAYIDDTGTDDDRPGRTDTPADDLILGFGLFTKPWEYPPMDESFRKAAAWHSWVWGG